MITIMTIIMITTTIIITIMIIITITTMVTAMITITTSGTTMIARAARMFTRTIPAPRTGMRMRGTTSTR
ncbi:MAG: hypothetical protein U0359_42275 [Byssovorax sp.]